VPQACSRTRRATKAVIAIVALVSVGIGPSGAAPTVRVDARSERERVRHERAAAAAELDVLQATNEDVEAALDALNADVAAEEAALADARRAAEAAEAALAEARAREAAAQAEIDALQSTLREAAVEAYINAGDFNDATALLQTDDIGDAVERRSLVELRTTQHRDVLAELATLSEELAIARADAEAAAQAAAEHQAEVDRRLGEVTTARDRQAAVAAEVDQRIEAALAEVASLETLDAELAREIAAEQAALAARNRSGGGGGGSGGQVIGNVSLTSVRGIQVATEIADELEALLAAASNDGITLGGGGYRSSESQWRLREQNCPDAANSPPSSCRPPTARPGQSMHERGLAVDFTYGGRVITSRSSPAFQWLAANAGSFGFRNLPSEPWHWSVNGQ
jgi:hypothetical protein